MNSRRPTLGGAGQYWSAKTHDFYATQLKSQAGPWAKQTSPPNPPLYRPLGAPPLRVVAPATRLPNLEARVAGVIRVFKLDGTAAGLREAMRTGLGAGAAVYLDARADHEPELAAKVARLRAQVLRDPAPSLRVQLAFLEARLLEVRASVKEGATPDQAVADKPEVPRAGLPKWLSYGAFALSLLAFFGAGRRSAS